MHRVLAAGFAASIIIAALGGCYQPSQFRGPGAAFSSDGDPYDWLVIFRPIDLSSQEPVEYVFTGAPPDSFGCMISAELGKYCAVKESGAVVVLTLLDADRNPLFGGTCHLATANEWVHEYPVEGVLFAAPDQEGDFVTPGEYAEARLSPGGEYILRIKVSTPTASKMEVQPVLKSVSRWVWP